MSSKQQTWIVLLVLISVVLVAGNWKPSQPLSVLYVPLALANGQSIITIAVTEGKGQICADNHAGLNQCTSSSYDLAVKEGDSLTFAAKPDAGYSFVKFTGPNGVSSTTNPLTVTVVQQAGATGYVHANFDQTGSPTISSNWFQAKTLGVPNWFLVIIGILALAVFARLIR